HKTANGERYNMHAMTAAHPTLPFNTRVQVKNVKNGRTVVGSITIGITRDGKDTIGTKGLVTLMAIYFILHPITAILTIPNNSTYNPHAKYTFVL
ncbi:hypothetical protein EB093_09495, partial [bacterium]|nr:hypothetical protein [bacterium]